MLQKLLDFTNKISDLPDKPGSEFNATELKAYFDSQPEELRVALNALIDALQATTGASDIGATPIEGVTGNTVQGLLEGLKFVGDENYRYLLTQLQYAILGQIVDESITPPKLHPDSKKASIITVADSRFTNKTVEGALGELFQYANNGKTEIANAITAKGVTASSSETFSLLATKIGQIKTGVNFASGTVTAQPYQGVLTIRNLTFKPKFFRVATVTNGVKTFSTFITDGSTVWYQYAGEVFQKGQYVLYDDGFSTAIYALNPNTVTLYWEAYSE